MNRWILTAALALTATGAWAHGAHEKGAHADAHDAFKKLSVAEVAELKSAGKVTVVDANGKDTRTQYGVVPGAVLLSDASHFDAAKELPAAKDQKLVFYCGGPQCQAAPGAAKRAQEAGYTDVAVMPDGIRGWAKAGQPTEKPKG